MNTFLYSPSPAHTLFNKYLMEKHKLVISNKNKFSNQFARLLLEQIVF